MDNETRAKRIKDAAGKTREALYAVSRLDARDREWLAGRNLTDLISGLDRLYASLPAEVKGWDRA